VNALLVQADKAREVNFGVELIRPIVVVSECPASTFSGRDLQEHFERLGQEVVRHAASNYDVPFSARSLDELLIEGTVTSFGMLLCPRVECGEGHAAAFRFCSPQRSNVEGRVPQAFRQALGNCRFSRADISRDGDDHEFTNYEKIYESTKYEWLHICLTL
jgi:hypothetical protein